MLLTFEIFERTLNQGKTRGGLTCVVSTMGLCILELKRKLLKLLFRVNRGKQFPKLITSPFSGTTMYRNFYLIGDVLFAGR